MSFRIRGGTILYIGNMTFDEKISFIKGVNNLEIDIFDEYGDTNEKFDDYHELIKDMRQNPNYNDTKMITPLLELFDDECFELSFMHYLQDIVTTISIRCGEDGFVVLLENLEVVPSHGQYHGVTSLIQMCINTDDSYELMQKSLPKINKKAKDFLLCQLIDPEITCAISPQKVERVAGLIKLVDSIYTV